MSHEDLTQVQRRRSLRSGGISAAAVQDLLLVAAKTAVAELERWAFATCQYKDLLT